MKKSIELEFRAKISEEKYLEVREFLNKNAFDEGDDSKDTYFFIWQDKFAKVVYNRNKHTAKASMKIGRVGEVASFEEIEFPMEIKSVDEIVKLFKVFEPKDIQYVFQFRRNYQYKKVSLALKYTHSWGFHIELERMITNESERSKEEKIIQSVADELGLVLMTNEELKKYTADIDSGTSFGKYTKEDFPYKNYYV
jgi:adenylate cyclase class IV